MKLLADIRRDDALRRLPLWLSACVAVALLLSGLFAYRAAGAPDPDPPALAAVLWCAVAPFLAFGLTCRRCGTFDLALPLSARRLWLAHVAAVLLAGALILAVSAVLAVALSSLAGRLLGSGESGLDLWRLAVHLTVGLGLAVAVLEAWRPASAEIPIDRGRVLFTAASLGGILALLWLLSDLPLVWTLVPLGLAVALGLRTYRSLPAAFTLVPFEAAPRALGRRAAWPAADRRAGWRRGPRLVSWVAGGPIAWLAYTLIFFVGMQVADLLRALTGEPDMTVQNLLTAIYVLLTFSGLMAVRLPHFDALPLSRRWLFAALVVPCLAALILGYGAGRIATAIIEEPRDLVGLASWHDGYYVRVPARYLEIAWDGRPPAIGAPWGESLEPMLFPLVRGGRAGLYSPFPVTADSSPELFAFHIRRAVEAVYGRSIPESEIRERYLELDSEGRVRPRDDSLTLLADYPGLEPRDGGPTFAVVLTLVVVSWLLLFSLVLRAGRAGVDDRVRLRVYWGLVALLFLVLVSQIVLAIADVFEPWVARGLLEITIRRLGESWQATVAAWLVGGLAVGCAYRVARATFERIELPTPSRSAGKEPDRQLAS